MQTQPSIGGTWDQLCTLRAHYTGTQLVHGLPDDTIQQFLGHNPRLIHAIQVAHQQLDHTRTCFPELFSMDEAEMGHHLQSGFLNFYAPDARTPYVPLSACGPWIVTLCGAVVYETGGYGALGFGHAPDELLHTMAQPHMMANIMTPSLAQATLVEQLKQHIGFTRAGGHPFDNIIMMNSGSEAVAVATRIADAFAKQHTDPNGTHAGKTIVSLVLEQSFHGRTGNPARLSDSTRANYTKHLASFRDATRFPITVAPNDIDALDEAFCRARENNLFIGSCYMEPVMGEGRPGYAITPAFYQRLRELTLEHDALLIVDSIQAGLRTQGVLSISDYPGFADLPAPDMETYSKALNGGQYPLSVLAMTERAASVYHPGLYGNTMTAMPRACAVACAVLEQCTPEIRTHIVKQGHAMRDALTALADEFPALITHVEGTGLLISAQLTDSIPVEGRHGLEMAMRCQGINVIHGGHNALRFTPCFDIADDEIALIVNTLRELLRQHAQ